MPIYEEDKIFEIIESRKPRGNIDDPFGLKGYSLVYISQINF